MTPPTTPPGPDHPHDQPYDPPSPRATSPSTERLPLGHRAIIAFLAVKLVWDLWIIADTWPDFSRPKLGIAVALPVVLYGLLRQRNWAMNLAGVVCLFWIAFVVARLLAPLVMIEPITAPWPWSNLLAFPAIFYVLQNLRPDDPGRGPRPLSDRGDD